MRILKPSFFVSKLLIALILFPVFIFLNPIPTLRLPYSSEWVLVFLSTFAQAGLSAFFSVLLGLLGAWGLCAFRKKRSIFLNLNISAVELFCLLPALLPPLVTVLAYINVSEWFFRFPFSFYTVLSVHVLMNIGLSTVFFFRLLDRHTGLLPAYAFLHGAGQWLFLKTLLFFELRKDIILLFLLVFSFCWTSFSVPLLVGGTSGQTIEVFISEKLKDPATWPEAMALFVLETSVLFIFFLLLYGKERSKKEVREEKNQKLYLNQTHFVLGLDRGFNRSNILPAWLFFALPFLPAFLILLGLVGVPFFSLQNLWADVWLIKVDIISAWVQSLLVGLGTGFVTFALLSLVAFCLQDLFLRRFLLAYTGASTVFMGFAFLLLGTDSPGEVGLKWALGLSLLFLPALYRLQGETLLSRLRWQAEVAQLMGASSWMIFRKIIHPQCLSTFWFLSGVASFWAVGDFAYSSLVAGDQMHLALLIQDLLSSYRLELATLLTWLLILTGGLCFFLFIAIRREKITLGPLPKAKS